MNAILLTIHIRTIFSKAGTTGSLVVIGVAHPDIYKFLKSLKSEQSRCEMNRRATLTGEDITAPRKSPARLSKWIYNIVFNFAERTEEEYFLDYIEGS